MEELIRRMLPVGSQIPNNKDENEYSFAMEYNGPPVPYDLPRAAPIDIESIPTALVVSATALSDRLSLPVVQPLLTSSTLKNTSKELNLVSDLVVSPTSVITFDRTVRTGPDHDSSGLTSSSGVVGSSNGHESSDGIDSSGLLDISNRHDLSCELSDEKESSGTLGFSNGHDLSDGIESSDALGLSNGHTHSRELSGGEIRSSDPIGLLDDHKESVDFSNDLNQLDWNSTDSAALSSQFLSSEASSFKAEECEILPLSLKRTSLVTFCDTELSDTIHVESIPVEAGNVHERKGPESKIKKGLCYRCLKGNRFTEKEACIACNAKYCANCVLRAMGSMPEGRKCVTCIGYPIDESKRGNLGKCSRMLKRLLSELEIQQAMKAEKLCEANQLQPDHIYVNGKQLSQEEMVLLQGCSHPPSKLRPGSYWYDKVSGLWGKEGHKPCKIISPHLNVGGTLMANASNGNTQVFINNREITKVELRMLGWAGVQCAGNPHFWVNADGSYQEEGQKKMKGNIWDKAVAKLFCSVVSLPIPSNSKNPSEEEVNNLVSRTVPDYLERRTLQKLLLVGYDGSGTSTIFKQAKFLYKPVPFSDDEHESIKMMIQSNVYNYLGILLEGRERFEEESLTDTRGKKLLLNQSASLGEEEASDDQTIYSISPRLKTFSDWLLKVMVSGNLEAIFPAATREYAPLVEELWKDAAIQATYSRRSELHMLPSVASYFLERIVDISRMEYEPSNADILYAEGVTSSNGLAQTDFLISQSTYDGDADGSDQHEPLLRYQLIRVHSKGLGENCKWLEMFEDVRIVIFCVSMIDYDQVYDDGTGVAKNKMILSKRLFESIATHPAFEETDFLLILNKFDLLEKKIERVPLTQCELFADFNPVISRHHRSNNSNNIMSYNSSPAQQAFYYIAVKFKRLFFSLTGRKLYVSRANALEPESVDGAIRYARDILKWREEEREAISFAEYSAYSTEPSSFSH